MGSEMVIANINIRANQDLDKTRKSMLDALEMNIKTINAKNAEVQEYFSYSHGYSVDELEKELSDEEIWDELTECINETFKAISDDYEITYIYHHGWCIYLAGGMTWGDDPNESFGWFCKFSHLPRCLLKAGCIRF